MSYLISDELSNRITMAMDGAICWKSRTWCIPYVVFSWLQSGRKSGIFVSKANCPASGQSSSGLRIALQHVCPNSWPISLGSTGWKPSRTPKQVYLVVNFRKALNSNNVILTYSVEFKTKKTWMETVKAIWMQGVKRKNPRNLCVFTHVQVQSHQYDQTLWKIEGNNWKH